MQKNKNSTTTSSPEQRGRKRNTKHIDFKTLDDRALRSLANLWEKEARIFEMRMQSYMSKGTPNPEKLENLWRVGNSLWRRVYALESWKRSARKRQA